MIHWTATLPHAEPEDDYSILSLREFLSAILLTFALLYVVAMLEIVSLKERSQVTRTAILSTLQGELRRAGVDVGVTAQGEMVLPDRVFFDHGRHELKPEGAARLHVARAAARRAERALTALAAAQPVNPAALVYCNRLSNYLFILARAVNAAGPGDVLWQPGANR